MPSGLKRAVNPMPDFVRRSLDELKAGGVYMNMKHPALKKMITGALK
jgi:hypothetical protein